MIPQPPPVVQRTPIMQPVQQFMQPVQRQVVERVVHVPQVQERVVHVPQIQERVVHVPQIVEKVVERVVHVPVERVVEVERPVPVSLFHLICWLPLPCARENGSEGVRVWLLRIG